MDKLHSILFKLTKKYFIQNRQDVFYLFYYSFIESVLLLIVPLISAFIINSVLAHATISVVVLSFIVVVVLMIVTFLQIIKEYIVEKFEQKIFVQSAFEIVQKAKDGVGLDKEKMDKYLNYFFDVLSIQKFLPAVVLNSYALLLKVFVSMLLLLAFDLSFFLLGLFFIVFYVIAVLYLGKNGIRYAIERSDAKHESIYFIHKMVMENKIEENLEKLDEYLTKFIKKRTRLFKVVISQFALTYVLEGVVLSTFFILGAYLVYEGIVPIGEFIATEIIVISIISALKEFIKQIDYVYEISEGLYKVDKLSKILENDERI